MNMSILNTIARWENKAGVVSEAAFNVIRSQICYFRQKGLQIFDKQ